MPHEVAAFSAVSKSELDVKMALDPEDFTWCETSEAVYVESAGDEIPFRLWIAHESGILSTLLSSLRYQDAILRLRNSLYCGQKL
jgi:hypothetical protein